jgi:hypothetical protein
LHREIKVFLERVEKMENLVHLEFLVLEET